MKKKKYRKINPNLINSMNIFYDTSNLLYDFHYDYYVHFSDYDHIIDLFWDFKFGDI